jgi:hypothetical protein
VRHFNVAPSAFMKQLLVDEIERTRRAEVYVATFRCVPGMAVVVDPGAQKILARTVLPDLLTNLSVGRGAVTLELESDAPGATFTVGNNRLTLPTQLEQLDEGVIVHATVEAPGRPPLVIDRMVSAGLAGAGTDHWFIVLPRAP